MGLTHKHKHTHRNIALTEGICESHPRLLTLSNSHKCSKQHKITQQIHTPQGYFLTQHPHMVTEYHTHTHTQSTHTRSPAEASTLHTKYKLTNTVSTTHSNTRDTYKLRWSFSYTHAQSASQTYNTHTQT